MPEQASGSIEIAVSPEVAYDAVSDPQRVATWSPEFRGGSRGSGTSLVAGDSYRGVNRSGPIVWVTKVTVTDADRPQYFAFNVDAVGISISRWEYCIEPTATGCRVTETWTDRREGVRGRLARQGSVVMGILHDEEFNVTQIEQTLAAMKADLEGSAKA